MIRKLIFIFFITLPVALVLSAGEKVFLKENFNSLESWKPLLFPKIKEHSKYSIISEKGKKYLRVEANASASGIIFKKTFNVFKYPVIRWKWKVSNVLEKGNAREKSGDDYPIRIYVIFKYDPEKASFFESITYSAAKLIYGEFPPHSSLNYIWANRIYKDKIITNTYTDKAKMILLEMGKTNVGKWVEEEVNIIGDYKKAFKEAPPEIASLAIMSDTDNTGERAEAFIDYISVLSIK